MAEMSPEVEQQARGLIVILAASRLARLVRRIDFGGITSDGLKIWGYQADDFWLYYIEPDDGSLIIADIWQR